jgi:hypothetical protein
MLGRLLARLLLVFSFASAVCPATPEKPQKWLEVRSPHFTVITNGNEKQARRVIGQFERIREVFHTALPRLKVDTSVPIIVLAAKDEKTFAALGPGDWTKKGQLKRSGYFLRGPEKNFVLLRLDVEGTDLYHTVFHEYTHLLVNQNVKSLPLWLDEGLAEFYGNTRILDKEVQLGYPSGDHVQFLRENRLMPMDTLFKVDHSSPYYNEEHKGSVFYAQSWAFVHYLMVVRTKPSDAPLLTFLNLLEQDVDGLEAASRAFGDLAKVQKELESYIHQATYNFLMCPCRRESSRRRSRPPCAATSWRISRSTLGPGLCWRTRSSKIRRTRWLMRAWVSLNSTRSTWRRPRNGSARR